MPKQRRVLTAATALAAACMALVPLGAGASTGDDAAPRTGWCPQLQRADEWYGDNAAQVQQTIDERGRCSDSYDPHAKPVAVFDWDNTVIKNDISDQTIFWMLRHDKILQPKGQDWRNTSRYMTDAGADALSAACGTDVPAGESLPTSTDIGCADELLSVRKDAVTTDGDAVFEGYDHRIMEASYAWVAQINAGYRPAEVRSIARHARREALSNPVGATQQVGSSTEVAWIRYYPQIRDLIRTLKFAGFDVWVVSASPKETADVWGIGVGVPRHHTIGIRSLTTKGVLNGHLEGCGGIADGDDAIMPYIDGKRCFINKEILGIEGEAQLDPAPADQRQALAGGDATTDVTMLRDATGVRVALNRNKDELMCRAYHNLDGRWVVNPMFIEPMPKREEPYPCSTTAYEDADGNLGPVIDDDGNVIPDQEDTVF
ncbi:HAD family hydrolase [Solicola gregarius]|uniref:phosphoserine phosphatase n=1 Tax=Solicola gregarius TaxID=2908642 RepID=A0AA46TJN2_9ACTN|nr:haloacid dehalogenase-like hydrolase [Solicola gregarius]UYM06505.1 haloacid dehalogenase-like hydrolase [Solicola gregarius]